MKILRILKNIPLTPLLEGLFRKWTPQIWLVLGVILGVMINV